MNNGRIHEPGRKLRVLIADDELLCLEQIRRFLHAEPGIEIVAECRNGIEVVKAIHQKRPDLAFLDVKMPELDGFGVIDALKDTRLPAIVFVTAYDQFALRAFGIHAVDYLLKPFDRARFQTALRRARQRLRHNWPDQTNLGLTNPLANGGSRGKSLECVAIKSGGRITIVRAAEIDWICAADNYAELHVAKKIYLLRTTITAIANRLPANRFVRISRSVLVNVDRIKELCPKSHGDYIFVLLDGTRLTGSRNYRHNLAELLGKAR
jgi:two-component system, LytTR family, response regulator